MPCSAVSVVALRPGAELATPAPHILARLQQPPLRLLRSTASQWGTHADAYPMRAATTRVPKVCLVAYRFCRVSPGPVSQGCGGQAGSSGSGADTAHLRAGVLRSVRGSGPRQLLAQGARRLQACCGGLRAHGTRVAARRRGAARPGGGQICQLYLSGASVDDGTSANNWGGPCWLKHWVMGGVACLRADKACRCMGGGLPAWCCETSRWAAAGRITADWPRVCHIAGVRIQSCCAHAGGGGSGGAACSTVNAACCWVSSSLLKSCRMYNAAACQDLAVSVPISVAYSCWLPCWVLNHPAWGDGTNCMLEWAEHFWSSALLMP